MPPERRVVPRRRGRDERRRRAVVARHVLRVLRVGEDLQQGVQRRHVRRIRREAREEPRGRLLPQRKHVGRLHAGAALHGVRVDGRDLAHPDVAVRDGRPVVLQLDRIPRGALLHRLALKVVGAALELPVVLDEHAVEEERHRGPLDERVAVPHRRVEDDVVALPRALRARRVHERRILRVDGPRLPVRVVRVRVRRLRGIGQIGVEHLDLVAPEQDDPGVTAALPPSRRRLRRLPLQMELAVRKHAPGDGVPRLRRTAKRPLHDLPAARPVAPRVPVPVGARPRAVEKHHRVARRPSLGRLHLHGIGAVAVVDRPGVPCIRPLAIEPRADRPRREYTGQDNDLAFVHFSILLSGNFPFHKRISIS